MRERTANRFIQLNFIIIKNSIFERNSCANWHVPELPLHFCVNLSFRCWYSVLNKICQKIKNVVVSHSTSIVGKTLDKQKDVNHGCLWQEYILLLFLIYTVQQTFIYVRCKRKHHPHTHTPYFKLKKGPSGQARWWAYFFGYKRTPSTIIILFRLLFGLVLII